MTLSALKFSCDRALLFINTIKYLKTSQIHNRVKRLVIKPQIRERFFGELPERNTKFVNTILHDEKLSEDLHATFLNYKKKLNCPIDWNDPSVSRLWLYNLHYFEDLIAQNAYKKRDFHIKLIDSWQSENLEGSGTGWEPYPISLRVVNILKAWQAGLPLDRKHFESLFAQTSFLESCLEKHLLGNHYLVNLKALLFSGIIFDNTRWSDLAIRSLEHELSEQILSDGAHFELSPMYHALILVDVLDMYNLCRAYAYPSLDCLTEQLQGYIPKMLEFLALMLHDDQGVSFFNDSVDGIAPIKSRIVSYAKSLGFVFKDFDSTLTQVIDSAPSGYMIASKNKNKLIFDAAEIGASYLPGHGHADTLSFEFSIGEERVFVNSGISEYENNEDRLRQRQTKSHNTVEVNDKDSSQVWSSFRVAKRANATRRLSKMDGNCIFLTASHDGYKKIHGGPIHTRAITMKHGQLIVEDTLEGNYDTATLRFYLHPDLFVSISQNLIEITGRKFMMTLESNDLQPSLIDSMWQPEFGKRIPNKCIECHFVTNSIKTVFNFQTT